MKDQITRIVSCITILALTMAVGYAALHDDMTADAAPTISETQQNINNLNNQISQIDSEIDSIQEKQEILEEEMADLDAEIINTMTSIELKEEEIGEKETEIGDKQDEIEETAAEYEVAKQREEQQFQDMVVRLRRMYENGEADSVNMILGGNGLGDMLNRMDYTEAIYEYDRLMLQDYENTKNMVLELWNQLEEEKQALETAKAGLEAEREKLKGQKTELDSLLDKKKQQSSNYDAEIKKARQQASVAKAKLKQEQQQLKKLQEEERRKKNQNSQNKSNAANGTYNTDYNSIINSAEGSELGKQVARYACQFVGNPYVAGGTSLTNGADCSGFTYRVYADFNYKLPRTSTEQREAGTGVDYGSAQPGDLICYSGHVALYIGGGKIVHASTEKTGIKIGNAQYRTILAVRRIV